MYPEHDEYAFAKTPAEELLDRETRVAYGPVPSSLNGDPLWEMSWQITRDSFLLRGAGEHYFFYRRGEGVTVFRGANADVTEERLWRDGILYTAIASLNDLVPIHASAIALDGSVIAFTGPAGSGKSTLTAALGARGMPMLCDDTLILDLSDPLRIVSLPGHKRLKLRADAVALTGALSQEKVSLAVEKFYCIPPSGQVRLALPLAELIFLEDAPEPNIRKISGYECFARSMQEDHYSARIFAHAQEFDRPAQFSHLSKLAGRIPMACFARPRDESRFHEGVELLVNYLMRNARRPT